MNAFAPAPPPKSALGHYRLLSPTASVRVSPLCLGSMNFGEAWKDYMGECDQKTVEGILDFYYENGGNFIDTANNYQNGEAEKWIGEWMEKRGVREQIVLATKFTSPFRKAYEGKEIIVNSGGNGTKSLRSSLEMSLKNMKTSYIDLLYVHYWDFSCSIPEMMQSLNDLVSSGKVNYLGVSDAPAWIVSKANQYARDHGLRQFVVYQGLWSAARRDFEREIIPMCVAEGMGLIPWGSLGMGQFKSEEQRKAPDGRTAFFPLTEPVIKVSEALEAVAKRKETEITSIALAYVMHKTPYVFPVIGGRNIGHLKGNIEALRVELEKEDVAEIEKATPFELGFPMDVLGTSAATNSGNLIGGQCDWMEELKPIPPHKL